MADLAYLQGLIDSVDVGGTIEIPAGSYTLENTLVVDNSVSIRPRRDWEWVVLNWAGPAGVPMVRVVNAYQSRLERLWLVGDANSKPSHGIALQTVQTPLQTNTLVQLHQIRIGYGLNAGEGSRMEVGIGSEDHDAGNDYHVIDQCYIRLCDISIWQRNGQNTSWLIKDTLCTVSDVNLRLASNCTIQNCFLSVADVADILLDASDSVNRRTINLIEVGSEQSRCFLKADAHCYVVGRGVAWNDSDLYGTVDNQSFLELTGNLPQYVEFDPVRITKGGTKTTCDIVCKPADAGNARKKVVLRGARTLSLNYDLAASAVSQTHRVHIVRDMLDGSNVVDATDVVLHRQEAEPGDVTKDLPAQVVRVGPRTSNAVGSTNFHTFEIDHTFSGPGSSGVYDIADALPAGYLILGVTARRDFSIPLSPGSTSLRIGTAVDDDRWGANALYAGSGTLVSSSSDFTDGSPLWIGSDTDLRITKLEGGVPGGTLDGARIHFTVHAIRCVGAPI